MPLSLVVIGVPVVGAEEGRGLFVLAFGGVVVVVVVGVVEGGVVMRRAAVVVVVIERHLPVNKYSMASFASFLVALLLFG